MHPSVFLTVVLQFSLSVLAAPMPRASVAVESMEIFHIRASTSVNPAAVTNTTCTNASANIVFHDQNVAELAICGGIAGTIEKCEGAPSETTGSSGTAIFHLKTTAAGATINVSKGRWEGCVRAARAVCPTGELESTCIGGASTGNVAFSLKSQ